MQTFGLYFNDDEGVFDNIRKYYNLSLPPTHFLHRNKEGGSTKKRSIYLSTPRCREIVENNTEKVKIINTGVKSFARSDNKGSDCDYR